MQVASDKLMIYVRGLMILLAQSFSNFDGMLSIAVALFGLSLRNSI